MPSSSTKNGPLGQELAHLCGNRSKKGFVVKLMRAASDAEVVENGAPLPAYQ